MPAFATKEYEVARGKTKVIYCAPGSDICRIVSLPDMTAGNGAKHATVEGKEVISNRTACNIFKLLARNGVPVAFTRQDGDDAFFAPYSKMIKLEVVGRFRIGEKSSYRLRHPKITPDHVLSRAVVEYFLKTTDKVWKGQKLPCDDPYLYWSGDGTFHAYEPNKPLEHQKPMCKVSFEDLEIDILQFNEIQRIMDRVCKVLKGAFDEVGADLADFKCEFGFNTHGKLLVADLIDGDSMRVSIGGVEKSKQLFRDDKPLNVVKDGLMTILRLTESFGH